MLDKFRAALLSTALFALPAVGEDISITPLSQIKSDAVGLITARAAGIPQDFWQGLDATRATQLIAAQNNHQMPQARSILQRIMIAELTPPAGVGPDAEVILARVDYLTNIGALDQAEALLSKAGTDHPKLFTRWFETKLMLARPDEACAPLKDNPSLSDDLAVKIFCLAQNQDWFSAELALSTGIELGQFSPEMTALLTLFLDPSLLDEIAPPDVSDQFSPLEFTIREALALPRSKTGLTLAQSQLDLDDTSGWLQQLRATERLTRTGALPSRYLEGIYHSGQAAASGGVWERVDAIADLDKALAHGEHKEACKALDNAWSEMASAKLSFYLADIYAQQLASLHLEDTCLDLHINTILLNQNYAVLLFDLLDAIPANDLRHAILTEQFELAEPKTPIQQAIQSAFTLPPLVSGAPAEALLTSLADIAEGTKSDPRVIEHVILALRAMDLKEDAVRLALELIILEDWS